MWTENTNNTDQTVWTFLDLMLVFLASSTLAYEIVLFSKFPLWSCYPAFIVAMGIQLCFWIRLNVPLQSLKKDTNIIALLLLCLFCVLLNVFTLRPDPDDFSFFHRALYGIQNLASPIPIFHTAHDIKNLPAISPVHLTTSIEVMTALFAQALGIQPLFFYQILNSSFSLFFFPLVYYVFFRYFGFSHLHSYIGVILIILLYIFSGDSHQDWGNFTIVRAWQGKCILILLFVPLMALLTYRFMQNGSSADFFRLHLAATSSIGLSGTAFFLIPFIIAISLLSTILTQRKRPGFLRKVTLLSTTLIPFAIVASLIKLGCLPEITNTDVWQQLTGPVTGEYLRPEIAILKETIFLKTTTLYFYLISVIGLLLFPWKNKIIKEIGTASLFISILLIFPPISNILIKITLPAAYWRLAYATQMLLIMAIFILLCLNGVKEGSYLKKTSLKILGISFLILFAVLKSPAITPAIIARPHQFKFSAAHMKVAQLLKNWVPDNSTALIPEELLSVVGLLRPDIAFVCVHRLETLHVFSNAGRKEEALGRIAARNDLSTCGATGMIAKILDELPNLNLLIFPSACDPKTVEKNLQIHHKRWLVKATENYQVWLKNTQ